MLNYTRIEEEDISDLEELTIKEDLLTVVDSSVYNSFSLNQICYFAYKHGYYCLPTTELAQWLKDNFNLSEAIEIGAGHGALSKYLGIPGTDSGLLGTKEINLLYTKLLRQPVVTYPETIIKLDAIGAIKKYKPKIVIGCWVTHLYKEEESFRQGSSYGIDEEWLLDNVEKYIVVGNTNIHSQKKILERPHKEYKFPWLYSRSKSQEDNIIYVWE